MTQKKYDNFYKHFYINSKGEKRKNGIFAPGIDRFILIDDEDFWITLQTAEILSSKLPTIVYMLPTDDKNIDNKNCINYTIYNKTEQKIGPSDITSARQHPLMKFLYDSDLIVETGIPEDYKDNTEILENLISYTQYVQQQVYVLNITDAFYNVANTNKFSDLYIDNLWLKNISTISDRSNFKKGIFFELRKILYLSNTIEESEKNIVECWLNNSTDQVHLMIGYYKILNKPIPEKLIPLSKTRYTNTTTASF